MNKEPINLISDTITRPTKGMLAAMMNAKVGDDVFGMDPTVIELQHKLSDLFGMEAALFFPSGTMANQTAIKLHTQPGEQMICDKWAHVYNFEAGGAAFNSGISAKLIDGHRGMYTANQLEQSIHDPDNYHLPLSRLVTIENTTNKGGGACWDFKELERIRSVCKENQLKYHLDGARLFNALVYKKEEPRDYGRLFDTISICLSKGLGAPIGSVLLGTHEQMHRAKRIRKLFGGAMRQVGYLAAAGIYALDNHVDRLTEDHERASQLAKSLDESPLVEQVDPVETNIVIFTLSQDVDEQFFINALKEKNILLISMGEGKMRLVTHLEFDDKMLAYTVETISKLKKL